MKNLLATLALGLLTASPAMAQSVGLSGMMGGKALIIVDGSPPKTVAVGETYKGVRIVSTQGDQAVIEMSGRQHTLRVGDAPANVGAGAGGGSEGNRIVLTAGSGGHFVTLGQINGKSAQMVIDTGATAVSMGVSDAQRLGIDYQSGQMVRMSTANGVVPGWVIKLSSVRVGNVSVHGVDAVVSSGSMPYVLLGNSFLTHFQMNRSNDQMVLEKRY
ncbi:MAG TPA: TIGR02281 family clan AA aspartic protease [Rhodoferax sp.]|jgi:aspartyl protease family protein|nr:TIGR02281 family clan AA aspartic protease [Rhodoferax sp.]HPW30005.1 TIGR02281 family clan AA aspartic protease [Rhodoferax sp.]